MSKTLTVYLAADVSKLNSGLNKGKRDLKDFENGTESLGTKLKGMLGPAMIGAGIAVAGLATAMAIDGVKAAIQEEKELARLSVTLKNLGFAAATDELNTFVDDLQYATGVSDSEMRPALERLLIATKDVATAQTSLQLAMDISQGTGRSLESVANALGKAYEGNYGALGKLNAGLDKAILKTGDMEQITKALGDTFGGQAATAADTWDGKLKRLAIAGDELKESFGTGFLDGFSTAMGDASGSVDTTVTSLKNLRPQLEALGKVFGQVAVSLIQLGGGLATILGAIVDNPVLKAVRFVSGGWLTGLIGKVTGLGDAGDEAGKKLTGIDLLTNNGKFNANTAAIAQLTALTNGLETLTGDTEKNTAATQKASAAQKLLEDRYQATLEVFNLAKGKLSDATRELEKWNSEIDTFISNTAGKIMSGLNIGAAFEAATSEAGKAAGLTTATAFQEQMAKSLKFGGLLAKLKSSGAKDNLIQQVAGVGPEAGVALAEDLIQSGLIPTLQSQLDQVQAEAATLAASLVPPFLLEGQSAARGAVAAALIEFQSAQTALEIAGKAAGKSFGAGLLDEIEKAIKAAQAALQNVQGGTGMSTAVGQDFTAYPGGSPLSAQEANMFDIAAYNANYAASLLSTGGDIDRVIRQSNNRNGWYEMPTVTPVLQ